MNKLHNSRKFPDTTLWLKRSYFLWDQTFLLLLCYFMTATNWYNIIYISYTGISHVMLQLLTKLLIKQQIHPAFLKCKRTHKLQNCFGEQGGAEYKETSSTIYSSYIYYYIALSLHFSSHWIMRAAVSNCRLSTAPGSYTPLFPIEADLLSYIGCFSHSTASSPHKSSCRATGFTSKWDSFRNYKLHYTIHSNSQYTWNSTVWITKFGLL